MAEIQPFFKEENGIVYRPYFDPELGGIWDGYEIAPESSACHSCNDKYQCQFAFDPYCDTGECLNR